MRPTRLTATHVSKARSLWVTAGAVTFSRRSFRQRMGGRYGGEEDQIIGGDHKVNLNQT